MAMKIGGRASSDYPHPDLDTCRCRTDSVHVRHRNGGGSVGTDRHIVCSSTVPRRLGGSVLFATNLRFEGKWVVLVLVSGALDDFFRGDS